MDPQLRKLVMLYSTKTTSATERNAAMRGLERFKSFGVHIGTVDVDSQKVGRVVCGEALKRITTSSGETVVGFPDLHHLSAANAWHFLLGRELMTGIAITGSSLVRVDSGRDLISDGKVIGLAMYKMGAVANVGAFRTIENATVRDDAIRLMIIHELGHVFGIGKHCTQNCVMQENKDKQDFIERFVIPGLDFCRDCVAVITRELTETFN